MLKQKTLIPFHVNVFRVKASSDGNDCDFKSEILVNGKLDTILADTGAKVSVCGLKKAKEWNLLDKMIKSDIKIKPYKSDLIPTLGASSGAVSFGASSVPVEWQIIQDDCEPDLAGVHAKQLEIIKFCSNPSTFMPINMKTRNNSKKFYNNILSFLMQLVSSRTTGGNIDR